MKKQKIIIVDFNRTLYDPEKRELIDDVDMVLRRLANRFRLVLMSAAVASRIELVEELGIAKYFTKVVIAKSKNKQDVKNVLKELNADAKNSFVIGDRIKSEISIGNSVGLKTIWIKTGKFAAELPENEAEKPTYNVNKLKDILRIVEAL